MLGFIGSGSHWTERYRGRRRGGSRCNRVWSESVEGGLCTGDWREFRAKLVLGERDVAVEKDCEWCHLLTAAEPGCLLLANPKFFGENQVYFRHAVILLLQSDENGAHGIIINKRMKTQLKSMSTEPNALSNNRIYFGGDVGETMFFIHDYTDLRNTAEVLPGVFCGGYEEILEAAERGTINPERVKVFLRYCGWAPQQLQDEIEKKVWIPAACSKEVVLSAHVDIADSEAFWRKLYKLMGKADRPK
mmetsp:Transcript_7480/g.33222  ORF Transcript_7480/g.33222 Transcript_7480/m.33222 type:complete len:247 (+) Transcript_7480:176-916(+)